MKKEEVEKIEKICNEIADKFNTGGKIYIAGNHFKDLAKAIASQITIDEGEVERIINYYLNNYCIGEPSPQNKIIQALKKADIIKIEEE